MILTVEQYQTKYKKLIDLGVITFNILNKTHFITIDRFDGIDFLCDKNEVVKPRAEVRKMGYTLRCAGIGAYGKNINE